ncbi:MAG: hypothetical protein ACLQVK_24485 [Acidimicrobiales bacterium]
MSISATDPFWSALASYDLGTTPTFGATTEAEANPASTTSSSVVPGSSATPSSGTTASTSSATGSSTSASSAIADLLDAGPSGVAVAVRAAVDNSILDAML